MFKIRYYEMGEVIAEEYASSRQSAKHKAKMHKWEDYGTESNYGRSYQIINEDEEEDDDK